MLWLQAKDGSYRQQISKPALRHERKVQFSENQKTEALTTSVMSLGIVNWYTRQDSNLRPLAPQANALSS